LSENVNRNVIEEQIAHWRASLDRVQSHPTTRLDELEDRLRVQANALLVQGLTPDEAFQIAVQRIGRSDPATGRYAREHILRKLNPGADKKIIPEEDPGNASAEFLIVLYLAIGAAAAIKLPTLFGYVFTEDDAEMFYARNISFFVFPLVAAYFAWKRGMDYTSWRWMIPPFIVAAVFCNVYPFMQGGDTPVLTTLHAPVALWLVLGFAYTGGNWRSHERRMDFVRFSGQLFILFVLIALGGGVLSGITLVMFNTVGINLQDVAAAWIMPCGAMGTIIIASWLIDTGRGAIEQVAPVLTRIFTPLFALMLLAFIAALLWTGLGLQVRRELLIAFDLLLIVVLGLVLYAVSARNAQTPPGIFDGLQIALVVAALAVDVLVLASMTARIAEFGFTPNRLSALGLNVILFINLAWTAWLYIRYVRGRGCFTSVERWQTAYLPVYAVWAGFIVVVIPVLFGYR